MMLLPLGSKSPASLLPRELQGLSQAAGICSEMFLLLLSGRALAPGRAGGALEAPALPTGLRVLQEFSSA